MRWKGRLTSQGVRQLADTVLLCEMHWAVTHFMTGYGAGATWQQMFQVDASVSKIHLVGKPVTVVNTGHGQLGYQDSVYGYHDPKLLALPPRGMGYPRTGIFTSSSISSRDSESQTFNPTFPQVKP